MAPKKRKSLFGWHFFGFIFRIDSELDFLDKSNPSIDTSQAAVGGFIHKIKTAIAATWQVKDETTGESIFKIDANTKKITVHENYNFVAVIENPVIPIVFADSPYTAQWGDDLEVDCTGGDVIINYPTAVNNNGKMISAMRIDASGNTITTEPDGTETINGDPNKTIVSQWDVLLVKSNGTNLTWR